MNRFKTDFLCASSTFVRGFGSVLNLRGSFYDYNRSNSPDEIAIAHDWRMIGQDLRDALEKAEREFRNLRK